MKSKSVPLLLALILLFSVPVSADETSSTSCEILGESTEDRVGCLDSDGDGWSDPDVNWNISMGADAFPNNASEHSDLDGDGIPNSIDNDDDGDGWNDSVDQFDLTPFSSLLENGPFLSGTMDLVFTSPRGHEVKLQIWYPTKEIIGNRVIYDNILQGLSLEDSTPDCTEPRPVTI